MSACSYAPDIKFCYGLLLLTALIHGTMNVLVTMFPHNTNTLFLLQAVSIQAIGILALSGLFRYVFMTQGTALANPQPGIGSTGDGEGGCGQGNS